MKLNTLRRLLQTCMVVVAMTAFPFEAAHADNAMRDGARLLLESLGTIPGSRWLDGRTANGSVGLAPRFGEPFSGTVWEAHSIGPRVFELRNLGDIEGTRWLTCRADNGAVTLSASQSVAPPATTAWRLQEFDDGSIALNCGLAANAWLDGRTQTAAVGLAPSNVPPFTGARWKLHEVRAADVLTNRNDNARTGASLSESILTPALLKSGRFSKLFTRDVEGQIYAQPLYAGGLAMAGGHHNVVVVATTQNLVYAFDADDEGHGSPLWKSAQLGVPVPRSDIIPDPLIDPSIGIISTPVIDRASGKIFVVAKSLRIDAVVDSANLADGDVVAIQTEGNIPGSSWLDGRTGNGTVGLAPQFGGDAFTGTLWQVARHPEGLSFRTLGTFAGPPPDPRWLDGRTAVGTVGLAPNFSPPFTGAAWRLTAFEGRGFTMQTLGTIPGPTFLDGRTLDGSVGLIPVVDAAHSGAVWRVQRHSYHNVLFVLDLLTGRVLQSTEIGVGNAEFVAKWQLNRPGLLLSNGMVYVGFGAHADRQPWHGWVYAFRASDLHPAGSFNTTPGGNGAGLWQSGTGLTSDEAGLIYVMTGNGNAAPGAPDLSNSFVQLRHDAAAGQFQIAAFFRSATNQSIDLNVCDLDLGSSGPVHVPGTHTVLGGGKQGMLYNLDSGDVAHPRQSFMAAKNQYDSSPPPCGTWLDVMLWPHLHGSPALWTVVDGSTRVYMWAERDKLKGFRLRNGMLETVPFAMSEDVAPNMSMPGGVLSISADGAAVGTGIVWATRPSDCPLGDHSPMDSRPCNAQFRIVPGILKAFDANNLQQLWTSAAPGDALGMLGKFNPPTIARGRVYVGTFGSNCSGASCLHGQLVVYGVRPGT